MPMLPEGLLYDGSDIKNLQRSIERQAAIFAVDLLTDNEIDELKALAELDREERGELIEKKLKESATVGIYTQLADLGFIWRNPVLGDRANPADLTPKAFWAIERRKKLKAKEEAEQKETKRQKRYDRIVIAATGIGGVILGAIMPTVLAFLDKITTMLSG